MLSYNNKLIPLARQLRKNMSGPEVYLWSKLRMKQIKGYQFNRQKPVGNYIVDFYCQKARLVVEIDGDSHYSVQPNTGDTERDNYLRDCGLTVLRFNNLQVMHNIDGVIDRIMAELP